MSTMLVRNADVLVTMDKDRREILKGGLYALIGLGMAVHQWRAVAGALAIWRVIPGVNNALAVKLWSKKLSA